MSNDPKKQMFVVFYQIPNSKTIVSSPLDQREAELLAKQLKGCRFWNVEIKPA